MKAFFFLLTALIFVSPDIDIKGVWRVLDDKDEASNMFIAFSDSTYFIGTAPESGLPPVSLGNEWKYKMNKDSLFLENSKTIDTVIVKVINNTNIQLMMSAPEQDTLLLMRE